MTSFTQIALLVAGTQGVLLSFALIISGAIKKKPSVYLGILLLVFCIELLNAWAMGNHYHKRPDALPFWILGSYLLVPASLWLFLQTGFNHQFRLNKLYYLAFTPALIEILTELTTFYIHRNTGYIAGFLSSAAWFYFTEALPVAGTIAVLITFALNVKWNAVTPARDRIKQQGFLISFGILALLWVIDALLRIDVYHIIEWLICALVFTLGYVVYFVPTFFEASQAEKVKQATAQFSNYNNEQELKRLKLLFDEEKVYLRARLSVEEIGQQLGLPHRYVSYLINHVYGTTFSNFVNTYRVNEVLMRMKDPREQHKNLLGIALDSGFSSKSSFNLIFKSVTGQTPSAYLAMHKQILPET